MDSSFISSTSREIEPNAFEKGKLFIGGLSWSTTNSTLEEYFEQFGGITSCCIMVNSKTGKPRGFGFVSFDSEATFEKVLSGTHIIDGKEVEVKQCTRKTLNRLIRQENDAADSRKIFLGGIPHFATEAHLHRTFEQHFGQVEEAVIICRPNYSGGVPRSRGFGFITFEEDRIAQLATLQRYIFFMGKQVEIKPAEKKNPCESLYTGPNRFTKSNPYPLTAVSPSFSTPPLTPMHERQNRLLVQCQPNQMYMPSSPEHSQQSASPSSSIPSPPMVMVDRNYPCWLQSQVGVMQPMPYGVNHYQSGFASYQYIE